MRQCRPDPRDTPGGTRVTTHHFDPETFCTTLGAHPPALRVQPGDTVVMQTLDAFGVDGDDERCGQSRF